MWHWASSVSCDIMPIGWVEFFSELENLLLEFRRRYVESNEHYCEYAISRCSTAIRAVSGIEVNAEQLLRGDELQSTEDHEELQSTLFNSMQLILSIRTISSLWEERLEYFLFNHLIVHQLCWQNKWEDLLLCWAWSRYFFFQKCHFHGSRLPDC